MKKLISILLALILILSSFTIAFASEEDVEIKTCDCENIPIVYVPGFGAGIYLDPENDDRKAVYPPSASSIIKALPEALLAVFGVLTNNENLFGKMAVRAGNKLLAELACDENGNPIYNTSIDPFEYPEFDYHQIETDNVFVRSFDFEYDWRLSPLDNAHGLKDYIEHIKELTGHETIMLMCHSQGNTVVAAYLELYGSEGIEKIAFLSPAYQGISILGSLFNKEADISDKADQLLLFLKTVMGESKGTDVVSILVGMLNKSGLTDSLLNFLQKYLTSQFDLVFDECLKPSFGNLAGIWSFVPDEYFDNAVEIMFGENSDAPILEKIRYYHDNVQVKLADILQETRDSGTQVIICAGYNISTIPVSLTPTVHSDFLIDTEYMSIGATCAPIGETFANDYVQAVDCGHNHISADRCIDASTGAFPEYTWYFSGLNHNDMADAYASFLNVYFLSEEEMSVHTYEEYPQFMKIVDGNLVPVEENEESEGILNFFKSILSF
ncbi:MAG: hypothetical protein J6R20_06785 [Clostridia bacterium]|nr:hypothetical protein [Clostridia bacterium]